MSTKEQCEGCAYDQTTRCRIFTQRINNCWNHTTKEEAEKREEEIKRYTTLNDPKRP